MGKVILSQVVQSKQLNIQLVLEGGKKVLCFLARNFNKRLVIYEL